MKLWYTTHQGKEMQQINSVPKSHKKASVSHNAEALNALSQADILLVQLNNTFLR